MPIEFVMDLVKRVLWLAFFISAPILGAGMVVGVIVSVVQAATQVQEQSVSFVLKLAASGIAIIIFGPTLLMRLIGFVSAILGDLGQFVY